MTLLPIKVILELGSAKDLEFALETCTKVRGAHPDIVIDAEIRVRPKD